MKKQKLANICICYHSLTRRPGDRNTYISYLEDVKGQIRHLKQLGYTFVNGAQYKSFIDGSWNPPYPICLLMWDDARANADADANPLYNSIEGIQIIMPWLIRNKISCTIPIITRRQRKYQSENGFASWKMMRSWITQSQGRIDVVSHSHNVHHLANVAPEGNAYSAEATPIMESPCWVDNGDYVYTVDPVNPKWYWDQGYTENAFAVPIWGIDQYDGSTPITTTFSITPKVTTTVNIIRFWAALSYPSGRGYDIPIKITANGVVVFNGTVDQKRYETRDQWAEREWISISLDNGFSIVAGNRVNITFETLSGPNGAAALSCYCLPLYYNDPGYAGHLRDSLHSTTTTAQGWWRQGTQGAPNRSWQYMDWPANTPWPVIPFMILADGTGRNATDEEYEAYVLKDLESSQFALSNYLMSTWKSYDAWKGRWLANESYLPPFSAANKDVFEPEIGYQTVGWHVNENVNAVIPTRLPVNAVVDSLKIWIGDVIPVDVPFVQWANVWDDYQLRNYNIIFDVQVSEDKVTWTKVGQTATWIAFRGQAFDIDPTAWTANTVKYIRLFPVNRGIGPTKPENICVYSVIKVILMVRTNVVSPRTQSYCYPFGAYQANGSNEVAVRPNWQDVSERLKRAFTTAGIGVAYTIQALRNYLHTGSDIGYQHRLSQFNRGRLMVVGDIPQKDTINLLNAYSGALFKDVEPHGKRVQVSLEGDILGHGTVKRRIDAIDYFAFDAWGFSGTNPPSIIKTVAPINDGSFFPGYGGDLLNGSGTLSNEKEWIQSRGGKALIIINNNLGTGEPNSEAGMHIFNNPDAYVAEIVKETLADGWDGVTCNIEGVAVSGNNGADIVYRERASVFYRKLGIACKKANLILHCTAPATTGNTNYDWVDWVGWCDHGEIIKWVDGMKIMSYTESNEQSVPRAGAWDVAPLTKWENPTLPQDPRSFWQAVVEHTNKVIPKEQRAKIMMGARAFGHMWYPNWSGNVIPPAIQAVISSAEQTGEYHPIEYWKYTNDPRVPTTFKSGENTYISYADLIVYCAMYAIPIEKDLTIDTTEMTLFGNRKEVKAWAGTPETITRSIKTASENGYGGIGIWKIDDGDIVETFPEYKSFAKSGAPYISTDLEKFEPEDEVIRFNKIPVRKIKKFI